MREFLRPGMKVIDVGANIGVISTICGLRVRPTGAVHSFEPLSSTFEVLKKNISTNGLEGIVTANRMAVTDRSGDVVKFDYCDLHSDITRISNNERDNLQGWHAEYEQVSSITLDDYVASRSIAKVDFFKIDVEGAELLVLAGAHKVLESHRPTVLCEFNFEALKELGGSCGELWDKWIDYGYSFFDYNHRARKLTGCKNAPGEGSPTYIGTTDPERLSKHIGAKIV